MHFLDRSDAGQYLARELTHLRDARDLIVLALPRGGVPVGYEIARELHAPLDVFVVRKLGVPGREDAMGALASGGVRFECRRGERSADMLTKRSSTRQNGKPKRPPAEERIAGIAPS